MVILTLIAIKFKSAFNFRNNDDDKGSDSNSHKV